MKLFWIRRIAMGILFFAGVIVLFGGVVMVLWNALVPALFHGPELSFFQALGLLILSHILFRGCGPRGHHAWGRHHWKSRWEKKLEGMTPEEREQYRAKMEKWCGFPPPRYDDQPEGSKPAV